MPDNAKVLTQTLGPDTAGDAMAEWYNALRDAGPVHRATLPDGSAVWLVTRYADVRAALADPRLSLDKANGTGWRGFALPPALDANLLNLDPPDHTRIRRLVSQAFTTRRVERQRRFVQRHTDRLLDLCVPGERADLIAALAVPLPLTVICELFGVPEADRQRFRAWTDTMVTPPPGNPAAAVEAVTSIHRFLGGLIAYKTESPDGDLLSDLVQVRDDGDRLSADELLSLAFLLLFAGYENVVHQIGTGLLALLRHPDQLAALRRDPALVPSAVEELMRFAPPAPVAIRRFPLEALTIGGTRIPAGETVLLAVAAANRDPARFAEPDTLDVGRADNPHLTLGHGIHYCLGAPLARLEVQVAISTVLRRLPGLALAVPAEELRWRPSYRTHGLASLPVTWTV